MNTQAEAREARQAAAAKEAVGDLAAAHLTAAARVQAKAMHYDNMNLLLAVAQGKVPSFGLICDVMYALNNADWS